jgi:hypothetical protein
MNTMIKITKADVNALLKLQGRNPLSPSDDQIRTENEKALQQDKQKEIDQQACKRGSTKG